MFGSPTSQVVWYASSMRHCRKQRVGSISLVSDIPPPHRRCRDVVRLKSSQQCLWHLGPVRLLAGRPGVSLSAAVLCPCLRAPRPVWEREIHQPDERQVSNSEAADSRGTVTLAYKHQRALVCGGRDLTTVMEILLDATIGLKGLCSASPSTSCSVCLPGGRSSWVSV